MGEREREWPGFVNARTLEGVPTGAGAIRGGRLFRSAAPVGDPAMTLKVLAAEDIRTVLDLRSAGETERRPSVLAHEGVYRVAPLIDPRTDHLRDPTSERYLLDSYRGSIDRNGRTISEVIQQIIDAPPGGVLVHCAAGKDRTGILIAILLAALVAPREAIIEDYTASQARLASYFADELMSIDDPAERAQMASLQHSAPDTIAGLLDHLDSRHGGAAAYLRGNGITEPHLRRLADRLTR